MVEIISDVDVATALGTLATQTAIVMDTSHATALLQSFLMKKVRAHVRSKGATTDDDGILVGMARGDATITEIKAALETVQLERDMQTQANRRVVLFETLMYLRGSGDGVTQFAEREVSLGGGNGIPFEDGDGWQWFAYNYSDGNLTTGQSLHLHATIYGVWL